MLEEYPAHRVARSVRALRLSLDHGFTSIRDVGTEGAGYDLGALDASQLLDDEVEQVAGADTVERRQRQGIAESELVELERLDRARGSSSLFATRITGFRARRSRSASSSSPGPMPARASTTNSTRSASATAARA